MRNYDNLICPRCGCKLTREGNSLYCYYRHCYDLASAGYVNLVLSGSKAQDNSGDSKEMMLSRRRIMDAGYYSALVKELIGLIGGVKHGNILDIGCGEGYIAGALASAFAQSDVRGADLSKTAVTLAGKRYKDVSFIVANSASLPVLDASVDVVTAVFTQVYYGEVGRILKEDGTFIRVTPAPEHLIELKEMLYENPYLNDITDAETPSGFKLLSENTVETSFTAVGDDIRALIAMTPYNYKTERAAIERVSAKESLTTKLAFTVKVYKKDGNF